MQARRHVGAADSVSDRGSYGRRGADLSATARRHCAIAVTVGVLVGACQPGGETTGTDDEPTDSAPRMFVEQCVGAESADLVPEFVGLTEAQLMERLGMKTMYRVVGRDGLCLDRNDTRSPNRLNVIVEDTRVVWAGRF